MVLVMGDCHESIGYRSPAAMGRVVGARAVGGVPRQLYLPVGVNQFCRFTSLAWPRCWAALVR